MGGFEKHIGLVKEKLRATKESYKKKNNTVVGDLAIKVVEQLVEADIAQKGSHFGDHKSRHDYANSEFPKEINKSMRKIWFAYGDLGYDGINGKRARVVMENLRSIIKFFEQRLGVIIDE